MLKLLTAGLLALSIIGCSNTSHVITGETRAAIEPEQVKIYREAPADYEEIAILNATSEDSWSFTDQGEVDVVIARLKERAASLGANGILIEGIGTKSQTVGQYSNGYGFVVQDDQKAAQAIAIHVGE